MILEKYNQNEIENAVKSGKKLTTENAPKAFPGFSIKDVQYDCEGAAVTKIEHPVLDKITSEYVVIR